MSSTTPENKRWLMFWFDMATSGHMAPGLWTHPKDKSAQYNSVQYWVDLAKLLEKGKFDGLFQADVLAGYDVYGGNLDAALGAGAQVPLIDPTLTVSAMAAATKNLSFGVTATTSYEHPYLLARKFSSLDHLTKGRVGWNVVTSYLDSAARQFGSKNQELHAKRYEVAHEYMEVVYKLWESSWADDAVKLDIENRVFSDPKRVRTIDHKGENYPSVPGPHICEPSLQRSPVIFQAGSSGPGMAFAAKHAEVIFIASHKAADAKKKVDQARESAKDAGRDPASLKVLALLLPVIGKTDEEAQAKYKDYVERGSEEGALALFGGWTGMDLSPYGPDEELRAVEGGNAMKSAVENFAKQAPDVKLWNKSAVANLVKLGGLGPVLVGSPTSVADQLKEWVEVAGVDGFNFAYALTPSSAEDIVGLLVPELQKRGNVWSDYEQADNQNLKARTHTGESGFGEGEEQNLGLTTREKLYGIGQRRFRDDHYASKFRWAEGKEAPKLD